MGGFTSTIADYLVPPAARGSLRHLKESVYPTTPPLFDGDGAMFRSVIQAATVYGEYGVGASTNYVYENSSAKIVAIETSPVWAAQILARKDPSRVDIELVDVGEVGDWGRPVDYSHDKNFPLYTDGIWKHAKSPDVVLIDGRFRVACFLTSILKAGVGTQIIFDDYLNRPHYHIIERVVSPAEVCGRQARFERPATFDTALAGAMLERFRYVLD